jgi:hypothetical protein
MVGSTIKITLKNSRATKKPLSLHVLRDPRVLVFLLKENHKPTSGFFVIGWFQNPSSVGVWFHLNMCTRAKRRTLQKENEQISKDQKRSADR